MPPESGAIGPCGRLVLCAALCAPSFALASPDGSDTPPPLDLIEFLGGLVLLDDELVGPDQVAELPTPDFAAERLGEGSDEAVPAPAARAARGPVDGGNDS